MTMKHLLIVLLTVFLSAGLAAQQGDRALWNEAERRFQSQDYELAIDRYDTLIQEYPVSQHIPDAQFRKAVALYRLDRLDESLELLALVDRRYRSTSYLGYVPFWRGLVLYELDRPSDSLAELSRFVSENTPAPADGEDGVDPDLFDQALLYKALVEVQLDRTDAATRSLVQLLGDEPMPTDQPYALSLLFSLQVQNGDYQGIQDRYTGLDLDSLDATYRSRVMLYGAEALHGLGDYPAAASAYRGLLDAEPQVVTVAYQRLFQYAQQEIVAESPGDILRQAEQALAGQTEILKELWLRVGIDSFNQNRFDLAELYFRRIWDFRRTEPVPASVPLYLSRLLDRRGDIEEAVDVLEEFLEIDGNRSADRQRVLVALGNFQIRTGDLDGAVDTLAMAVGNYPQGELFGEASYQYAFALWKTTERAEALATINAAFLSGRTGGVQPELLRLRSRLLLETGRREEALQALFEYLPLRPSDVAASLEYVNLMFDLGRYDRVVDEAPNILEELGSMDLATPSVEAQIAYVLGLARLNEKEYGAAVEEFARVLAREDELGGDLVPLVPYAQYYRGWSLYRQGDYTSAVTDFLAVLDRDAEHPFAARSTYLAGWCYFRLGEFGEATRALARVRSYAVPDMLAIEASYLLGRALASAGSVEQAAAEFRSLYIDYPDSSYADDAWFEYGQALAAGGSIDAAVSAFDELVVRYPGSNLAEDAVFGRAELLYGAARFAEARDSYFSYRTVYPSGRQLDAALYWGGQASAELEETAGAILLWERLIREHRTSPYRADAMQQAARLHAERGEFRQALNLYTELQASYPEVATAVNAQREIDELVLIINGLSRREAELYVTIEEADGAETETGRQAILELARLAIYEDTATGIDAGTVVPLLEAVAERREVASAPAAEALFMLGEYHSTQREFNRAAERYLEAALASVDDRDLAALSIYRAAEMYSTLGRTTETQALLRRLEEEFPASQWLEEARGLLGGAE